MAFQRNKGLDLVIDEKTFVVPTFIQTVRQRDSVLVVLPNKIENGDNSNALFWAKAILRKKTKLEA